MRPGLKTVLALALVVGACAGGPPAPGLDGGPILGEEGVTFRYENPDARRVHLVGDFNNWAPTSDPMTDENGDGSWSLVYPLKPGRYAYKFVIDGREWIPDPTNPLTESDGFDGQNSIIVVPGVGNGSK